MEVVRIDLGEDSSIHALVTKKGIVFSMSQVAIEVFRANPAAFNKELRRLRYPRTRTRNSVTLRRLAQLGIPPESATVTGATLLSPESLVRILDDRRRNDLIPLVRTTVLKMVTKEMKDLIIRGQYKVALPIVMDLVVKGQALYWPKEPLRMVSLYLLAVKVNLGLNRPTQSNDMLGVGSWLLLQDQTDEPKDGLRSEICQCFGKLALLNKRPEPSLRAFAEEVYYNSKEFGIYDVRTSISFYNMSRVFHDLVVLGVIPSRELPWGKKEFEGKNTDHLDVKQAIAALQMPEVCEMLQEICKIRSEKVGRDDLFVGEASYVTGLAFSYANKKMLALEHLQRAEQILQQPNLMDLKDFIAKAIDVLLQPPPLPVLGSHPQSPASPSDSRSSLVLELP